MKIIKLESENVKRLHAVQIKPDGSLIIIGGKNGAGKTSVLDSIQYALAGTDSIPSKPIREGEKRATVVLDLGDLRVTRIFTEKGSRLVVENKDGSVHKTPQSILDNLTGRLSFDPLEFARMDSKKQTVTLKNLMGFDFSDFDKQREEVFNERTVVNREIKSLEARIGTTPTHDVPEKEVSVGDLSEELERRMGANQVNATKRGKCNEMEDSISRAVDGIENTKKQIAMLEEQLSDQVSAFETLQAQHAEAKKEAETLTDLDVDEIKERIGLAEETNAKIRSNRQLAELESQHANKIREAGTLTKRLHEIDKEKSDLLAAAEFPVEGLAFNENGVLYNDLPFDQCSSAEQLRISVAMGIAMNPKLKILLIRDGSLLDGDNLSLIARMAEEEGAQVWLERVGEGKEVSVIIEDGSVKEG